MGAHELQNGVAQPPFLTSPSPPSNHLMHLEGIEPKTSYMKVNAIQPLEHGLSEKIVKLLS